MTPETLAALRSEYRRLRDLFCSLSGCSKEDFEKTIRLEVGKSMKGVANPIDYVRQARCWVEKIKNQRDDPLYPYESEDSREDCPV